MINYRYVYEDVDRHGNVRIYFWRKGQRKIRIRAKPGTSEFDTAYRAAKLCSEVGEISLDKSNARLPKRGTWRWLCIQYFSSVDFRRLGQSTQRVYRGMLEATFDEPVAPSAKETFADFPLVRMSGKAIRVLRDRKAELPEAANNRLKAVRRVFAWALENDHVSSNPARDVSPLRTVSKGHHTWSAEEVGGRHSDCPTGA